MKAVGAARAAPAALAIALALMAKDLPVQAHGDTVTALRFERDIRPILARACTSCHRAGGPAPMPLETYEEVRPWASAIKEEILERRMPPWPVVRGFGEIRNAPAFGERDVERIVDWVLGGSPRGPAVAVASPAPAGTEAAAELDAEVVFGRRAGRTPSDGVAWFEADVPATRPRWLLSLAWRRSPEDGRPASFFLEPPLRSRRVGRPHWIGSSSVGRDVIDFPVSAGLRLEPGSRLLLALRLTPGEGESPTGGSARLRWAADRPAMEVEPLAIPMAPQDPDHQRGRVRLETGAWVIAVRPPIGRATSATWVTAYPAERPPRVLVLTRPARAQGPDGFSFERPVYLSRGTEIVATARASRAASGPTGPTSEGGMLLIKARRADRASVPEPRWAPTQSDFAMEPPGFYCPMHPHVYRENAGACPLCGMELVAPPATTRDFELELETHRLEPNQQTELSVRIRDPRSGDIVKDFHLLHERPLHLFIVSQDLAHFEHAHPVPGPDGTFTLETKLPAPGLYKVFADLFPVGGAPQLLQGHLLTSGSAHALDAATASVLSDETRQVRQGRTEVTLKTEPAPPTAGRPVEVSFSLRDTNTGGPLADLQPYLGTLAHVVIASADLEECIHTHPREVSPNAAVTTSGARLSFGTVLPRPGLYRIWAQFQRGQELVTAAFTIRAAPLS